MKRETIKIQKNKYAYFAGDFHLGKPNAKVSLKREFKLIRWFDHIKKDAQEIFLMGDIFDFWFEYKNVIQKENQLFINKIYELIDLGLNIHYFKGNHDLWMLDFFENIGVKVYDHPQLMKINEKKILIGHGDGLGDGDYGYKILKKIFTNKVCQALYRLIHPDVGLKLGKWFSGSHKDIRVNFNAKRNNERLIDYCKNFDEEISNDAYIFGHSHCTSKEKVNKNSFYYNAGDWITDSSYLVFSNNNFKINKFE